MVVGIDGCTIPRVLVDGGSNVNMMLVDIGFNLDYTPFEETNQILRMINQSRIIPATQLFQVPTRIKEVSYLQNFVIIHIQSKKQFSMLLKRLWLY